MTSLNAQESVDGAIAPDLEPASAETILRWTLDNFAPKVALACSFQAEESVLIDMMHAFARRGLSHFHIGYRPAQPGNL